MTMQTDIPVCSSSSTQTPTQEDADHAVAAFSKHLDESENNYTRLGMLCPAIPPAIRNACEHSEVCEKAFTINRDNKYVALKPRQCQALHNLRLLEGELKAARSLGLVEYVFHLLDTRELKLFNQTYAELKYWVDEMWEHWKNSGFPPVPAEEQEVVEKLRLEWLRVLPWAVDDMEKGLTESQVVEKAGLIW